MVDITDSEKIDIEQVDEQEYALKTARGETISGFDDEKLARLMGSVYLSIPREETDVPFGPDELETNVISQGFSMEDTGERGIPMRVALAGKQHVAAYISAHPELRPTNDHVWELEYGVKPSTARTYCSRIRRQAREAVKEAIEEGND